MPDRCDISIRDIIANASETDLLDGLARRGAVTRRLSGGVVKVSVKLKEPVERSAASARKT